MNHELTECLEKPFNPKDIKQRKGSFGRTLDYIGGEKVIQRLNECFGGDWDFEILTGPSACIVKDSIVVHARITYRYFNDNVEFKICKEAFGGKKITTLKGTDTPLDIASDMKAAATDALKKAATLFGVALDLYSVEEKEHDDKPAVKTEDSTEPAASPEPATDPQKQAINAIARAQKKNVADILKENSVSDINSLTKDRAREIITKLNSEKR